MEVERVDPFNRQVEVITPGGVNFDWKIGSADNVHFNAFFPVTLLNLNLKTPSLYEVMGNSMMELRRADENVHGMKVQTETVASENVLKGEIVAGSDLNAHWFKH